MAKIEEERFLCEIDAFASMPNGRTSSLMDFGKIPGGWPQIVQMENTSIPTGLSLAKAFIQGLSDKDRDTQHLMAEAEKPAESTYVLDLVAGDTYKDGQLPLLNVPIERMLVDAKLYHTLAVPIISQLHDETEDNIDPQDCEANIGPRFGPVHVHHDASHGISTLRSLDRLPGKRPIKLWLFWPPNDNNMLAVQEFYKDKDTRYTYDLNNTQFLYRVIETFHAELNADQESASKVIPHMRFVELLERALSRGSPPAPENAVHAWIRSTVDLEGAFSRNPQLWARIRKAWAPYITKDECGFCRLLPPGSKVPAAVTEHVYYHFRDPLSLGPPNKKSRTA
ncbi:hypothetical protein LTS12_027576 [Elasticomyces elasticus]|nr:hypothetical protein LTS12_027576 [Elasticomyces elasticus]